MANLTVAELDDYVDDLGGTNTTTYTDAAKHRAYDRWSNNIIAEIMEAMQDYDFQGEISTHDIVASQREYIFPTDILKIKRIDLKLDGSNWKRASEIDASQLGNSYAAEADIIARFTNDEPYVEFLDNSFMIYSGSISNVTGGIKLTYSKQVVGLNASNEDITNFTADTHKSNLPQFAQMALIYGALIDYFTDKDENMVRKFNKRLWGNPDGRPPEIDQIGGLMRQIINYYTSKQPDRQSAMQNAYQEEDFN
ncbi:MAG: hypothetical protein [Siphoviridae sp. cttb18]|nr:MAG: hypothetical protein [Siphoviridae sp. cttb18]